MIGVVIFLAANFIQPTYAEIPTVDDCYKYLDIYNWGLSISKCSNCCGMTGDDNGEDCDINNCYAKMDELKAAAGVTSTTSAPRPTSTSVSEEAPTAEAKSSVTTTTQTNTATSGISSLGGILGSVASPATTAQSAITSALGKITTTTSTTKSKSTLQLPDSSAPSQVPHFTDAYIAQNWQTNDALITNLVKDSLIARLIVIAKYILGGVFMLYLGLYVITFLGSASKDEALKKFKDQMIWAFTGFLILALAEPFSQALSLMSLGSNSDSLLANPATTQISATLVGYSFRSAGRLIQYILGGVALLTMGISAFRMITAVGDEETVKNSRKSLVWASIGLLIAGATTILVDNVIAPNVTITGADAITQHAALLAQSGIQAKIFVLNYVKYFQTFIGAMAVFMLFLAGFKMVAAGGEEEIITKQKKMITWIFLGLLIILASETFVTIFMPATGGLGDTQIASFSAQLGGFTNFLLTFSGILSVLAMVVGGLYLSTSAFNAEQAEKGKKIMLAAALGLILTVSAYALVSTVLSSTTSSGTMINVNI